MITSLIVVLMIAALVAAFAWRDAKEEVRRKQENLWAVRAICANTDKFYSTRGQASEMIGK